MTPSTKAEAVHFLVRSWLHLKQRDIKWDTLPARQILIDAMRSIDVLNEEVAA